jgi:hypothetical protein
VGADQIEYPGGEYRGINYSKNPYQKRHLNKSGKITGG